MRRLSQGWGPVPDRVSGLGMRRDVPVVDYDSVLNRIGDGYLTVHQEGWVVSASSFITRLLEYQAEDICTGRIDDFILEEDRSVFQTAFQEMREFGRGECDLRFRSKSGAPIYAIATFV